MLTSLRGSLALGLALAIAAIVLAVFAAGGSGFRTAEANPHPGGSVDVAVVTDPEFTHGGEFPIGGVINSSVAGDLDFTAFNFTLVPLVDLNAANLANYDTVFLNVGDDSDLDCDVDALSAGQKTDLVNFVAGGHKMLIYDSECSPQDYSWLPFPFTTNNPGAQGAEGTVNIVEENTLSTTDPADSHFIDAADLGSETDAIGDMNVMVTLDSNWCLDMSGTNANEVTGPVHAYARFGTVGSVGLIIYNGMDMDYSEPEGSDDAGDWLLKIWLQELQQPFNSDNLPCAVPVAGIALTPETATNNVGASHTVTATVTDLLGDPSPDVSITFTVTAGPNAGDTGQGTTNASGQATFTYTGDGGAGTDTIEGCFLDEQEQEHCDTAAKTWVLAPTPTVTPAPTPTPTVAAVVQLPATGGTPSDGGSLPWLVLAAGVIAITSGGLALAYRTRRTR